MQIARYILILFISLLFNSVCLAYDIAREFSADAVQQIPARPAYQARMYVSKDAVRTESKLNDVDVVEIVNAKQQTRVLLVPKDKLYLQQKSDPQASSISKTKSRSKNPCEGLADTSCTLLAKEEVNGRKTEKWEFIIKRNGQSLRSLHWIDVERRMPIREFFPDGTVTELSMQGKEKVNGRQTEKWQMRMTRADGQQMQSTQWYDPELKIAIREEMQGGFVRELRNIKIAKQDKKLFQVPTGYKKVEQLPNYLMPQQTGQAQQPAQPGQAGYH